MTPVRSGPSFRPTTKGARKAMPDQDELKRLHELEARINRMRQEHEPAPKKVDNHELGQVAWRMVTELVAGLLVGLGVGFGLDRLFGTQPWLLLLFTLLGLVAGIRIVMHTAADLQKRNDVKSEVKAALSAADRRETDRG